MRKKSDSYLVATFEKFPGVQVPLLSDEECRARGIAKGRLPPFETWSPEQQAAGRKLGDALAQMAVTQAMRCMLRQLEAMIAEGYAGTDPEKDAALRAIAELRAGKWKATREDTSGLQEEMIMALECIVKDRDAVAITPSRKRRPRET
ncbi:MAG TPA: hypothetical protein VGD54_09580 [Steroidobacteraceae bacterium]